MEANSNWLEAIWRDLRYHLEWTPGFVLVLLFAAHPQPVEFLRRRLEENLQLRTLRLRALAPSSPEEIRGVVASILAAHPGSGSGPVWVELWRNATDEKWRTARRQALRQLNERRFVLERDVDLPLVLILPPEERSRFYIEAPDLWVVRSFTADLPAPAEAGAEPAPAQERRTPISREPGLAEHEWAHLLTRTSDKGKLDPRDGFAAFDSALDRGDLAAARAIASKTLDIAREREKSIGSPQALRDLSVSLDNVGQVESDLGNLEAARAAYSESLELLRRLREVLGDTPQALRDLSVSLNNVGQVESDLGNLEAARAAYSESLEIRRRLREALGDTPQALRDLSVSLNNVGQVESDLGNLEAARAAYSESLEICRRLREALGDTPQALRDLSVSLDNVGRVASDLGNLEAARAAYSESLEICRRLREALGDTPQALRDLSVSLNNVGRV